MIAKLSIACLALAASLPLIGCDQTNPPDDDWQTYQNCKARLTHQLDMGEITQERYQEEMKIQCDKHLVSFTPDPAPPPKTTIGVGTRKSV